MVSRNKREWSERLPEALWSYCITNKALTSTAPFYLVYGAEAVLPVEIQLLSLRVALNYHLIEETKDILRIGELESLEETRLEARQNIKPYQAIIFASFD